MCWPGFADYVLPDCSALALLITRAGLVLRRLFVQTMYSLGGVDYEVFVLFIIDFVTVCCSLFVVSMCPKTLNMSSGKVTQTVLCFILWRYAQWKPAARNLRIFSKFAQPLQRVITRRSKAAACRAECLLVAGVENV